MILLTLPIIHDWYLKILCGCMTMLHHMWHWGQNLLEEEVNHHHGVAADVARPQPNQEHLVSPAKWGL
jgi:hypothetical protein